MSFEPIVALTVAAALSWLLMPLGIHLSWSIGWLDQPEARKLHTHATAVLGGAVVFASAVIAWGMTLTRMPTCTSSTGQPTTSVWKNGPSSSCTTATT